MGDTDGWRRAALDYRSKFEEDFVFSVPGAREGAPPLRIAQAPSATAAEKRVGCRRPAAPADRRGAGSSARGAGRASPSSPAGSDDAKDPIPATGFTVWDAGVLLGAYVSQPEVWRRLTMPERAAEANETIPDEDDDGKNARLPTRESPLESVVQNLSLADSEVDPVEKRFDLDDSLTVLELGAGTGVAGLALASTGLPSAVALTDLPGVCDFLRHNASRNKACRLSASRKSVNKKTRDALIPKNTHAIPAIPHDVALAVAPLRWGVKSDVARLHPSFRKPRIVLGADLAYTEDASVVRRLAATVSTCVPRGGVAVFASCRDHRPESVDLLENLLVADGEFEARRVRGDELAEGFGRTLASRRERGDENDRRREDEDEDGRFESFRVVEFRRVAGNGMSDAEAEEIRARDARGDAQ